MLDVLRSQGHIVLNVTSSGIAALLLEGGRTTHYQFAIPINILEDSMCHIPADSDLADLICQAKLIIWDEAPMIQLYCYEAFDRTLREICRNGNIDSKNEGESTVVFPDEMLIPESDDYVGSIINQTYPHEMVGMINERMMGLIPGEERLYESSDSVCLADDDTHFDESIYTTDFLNGIKMSGLHKHAIKLKIGTPVMLMRNIDKKAGLCNGTRLQVLRMGINVIKGKIISGGNVGKICAIPRMVITPTDTKIPFKLNRRQFPI
ncbi:ATP-dependent DNA helicase PIF1-like protein [Tanacetum coccineum]